MENYNWPLGRPNYCLRSAWEWLSRWWSTCQSFPPSVLSVCSPLLFSSPLFLSTARCHSSLPGGVHAEICLEFNSLSNTSLPPPCMHSITSSQKINARFFFLHLMQCRAVSWWRFIFNNSWISVWLLAKLKICVWLIMVGMDFYISICTDLELI